MDTSQWRRVTPVVVTEWSVACTSICALPRGTLAASIAARLVGAPTKHNASSSFEPASLVALGGALASACGLSYGDVEGLLGERGLDVDHVSIYRWVQRFTPLLIDAARPCRHVPGDRWFVNETYVKVAGRWVYLYRAVDQHGQVIDVLVSQKRDLAATRRFFTRVLNHGPHPTAPTRPR